MDRDVFDRLDEKAPSPFGKKEEWAAAAARLWRRCTMALWNEDMGLYKKAVQAAVYCENRGN